jgi:hypothetical protein
MLLVFRNQSQAQGLIGRLTHPWTYQETPDSLKQRETKQGLCLPRKLPDTIKKIHLHSALHSARGWIIPLKTESRCCTPLELHHSNQRTIGTVCQESVKTHYCDHNHYYSITIIIPIINHIIAIRSLSETLCEAASSVWTDFNSARGRYAALYVVSMKKSSRLRKNIIF